jgi:hypothetical protein
MKRNQDDWLDQRGDMKDITHEELMKRAKAKYDLLVSKGTWGAKSQDQEKIIALEAQIRELKDLKLSAQLQDKLKRKKGKTSDNASVSSVSTSSSRSSKSKNKKDRGNKRRQRKDEEWKKKPPKQGESTTKTVNNIQWHWCEHHMKWTIHHPNDCKLKQQREQEQNKSSAKHVASQATTYHNLLANLAELSADE